jgi:hypothetical protein
MSNHFVFFNQMLDGLNFGKDAFQDFGTFSKFEFF